MIIKRFPPVCWCQILVFDNLTPPAPLTPNTKYWPLSDWQCLFTNPTNLIFMKLLHLNLSVFHRYQQKLFHRFCFLLTISLSSFLDEIYMSFHRWGRNNCATLRLGHFLEHCSIKFFPLIMTPPHQLRYLKDLEPAPQKPFYEGGDDGKYVKPLLDLCPHRLLC